MDNKDGTETLNTVLFVESTPGGNLQKSLITIRIIMFEKSGQKMGYIVQKT